MRTYICVMLFSAFGLVAQQKTIKEVPVEQTSPVSGVQMFKAYCASCHGISGKGNGPAASALKKAPADLTLLARTNAGKFPEEAVSNQLRLSNETVHGSAEMPVWGPLLTSVSGGDHAQVQLRIHNLVTYIQSIQAK
jgi:mono/diheme cytochrome c family protein